MLKFKVIFVLYFKLLVLIVFVCVVNVLFFVLFEVEMVIFLFCGYGLYVLEFENVILWLFIVIFLELLFNFVLFFKVIVIFVFLKFLVIFIVLELFCLKLNFK